MDYPIRPKNKRVYSKLDSPADTTLAIISQYYPVLGVFSGVFERDFTVSAAGLITYTGPTGKIFLFNGVSDMEVDKACEITYALYLNGVAVAESETPHDFTSTSKIENISTTSILSLTKGDELVVYAKSDNANTILTVNSLKLTFWGE